MTGQRFLPGWTASANHRCNPTRPITQRAEQLTTDAVTEWEKLQAIGQFAQGIKYVSIQMGTGSGGGYTPHPAPRILRNLYGDCKDKVTLMRSLLRASGIESYLVAIYSGDRRYVREEWPSPHQFNHVIIAIDVGDDVVAPAVGEWGDFGRLLLFDPTDPYTPLGQLPEYEQDSWALLTAPSNGLLIRAPSVAPEENRTEREATVQLSPSGEIEVVMSETSIGRAATKNRAIYRRSSKSDYRDAIQRRITRDVPAAKLDELQVVDRNDEGFDLPVKFTDPAYAQTIAGQLLVFKPAIMSWREGTLLVGDAARVHPVVLNANAFKESIHFSIPEGFVVDEKPSDVKLHTEFGDYSATWTPEGDTLVFARQLSVRNAEVDAADYASVRDFFRAVAGAEQAPVVLMKQ